MICSDNTKYFELNPKGWTKRTTIVRAVVAAISLTGVKVSGVLEAPELFVTQGLTCKEEGFRFVTEAEEDDEMYDEDDLTKELGGVEPILLQLSIEGKLPRFLSFDDIPLSIRDGHAFNFAHVVINYFVDHKYKGTLCFTHEVPGAASPSAVCSVYVDSWRAEIPEFAIVEGERQPPCLVLEWDPDMDGSLEHYEPVLEVCKQYGLKELGVTVAA